jgi:peptidoglycan/LPS O-acetylase OafA/YrhL
VYLIHQPLESTVFAWLYLVWQPAGIWIGVFGAGFLAVSLLAGWIVTRAFDEPTVAALKAWSRRISPRSNHQLRSARAGAELAK